MVLLPVQMNAANLNHCARFALISRAIELELIQSHMAQKPVLRGEAGCACVARKVSVERGGMGERGCEMCGVLRAQYLGEICARSDPQHSVQI